MTKEDLLDLAIRHQVYLERLKAGQVSDVAESIKATEAELIARIQQIEGNTLAAQGVGQFNAMLADLKRIETARASEMTADLMHNYAGFAATEEELETKKLTRL